MEGNCGDKILDFLKDFDDMNGHFPDNEIAIPSDLIDFKAFEKNLLHKKSA